LDTTLSFYCYNFFVNLKKGNEGNSFQMNILHIFLDKPW
jgi:hypothetical protein